MNDLDELYAEIKGECIKLIYDKNIDMEELSYRVGICYWVSHILELDK